MRIRLTICGLAACLLAFTAVGISAQPPYAVAYFTDGTGSPPFAQAMDCKGNGVVDTLFVFAHNLNTTITGGSLSISYPASVLWLADLSLGTPGSIVGATPTGIAFTYPLPVSAGSTFFLLRVLFQWTCPAACKPANQNDPIIPDAITFNTFTGDVPAIGLISLVCATDVPVEDTNWGRIKALYR